MIEKQLTAKGLRKDLYMRVKKVSNDGDVQGWIDEVQNKLFYFKDFDLLRVKMNQFYQNKLCNWIHFYYFGFFLFVLGERPDSNQK